MKNKKREDCVENGRHPKYTTNGDKSMTNKSLFLDDNRN